MALISNIDTLYASVLVEDYTKYAGRLLEELQKKLEERFFSRVRSKDYIDFGGVTFELVNGRYSWSYGLMCNDFTLYLAHHETSANYPIYVEFRQEYLWQEGFRRAWEKFLAFIKKSGFTYVRSKISRADLACHTDLPILNEDYLKYLCVDPRCKNFEYTKGMLTAGDYDIKSLEVEKFGRGKKYTGIRVGMGNPIMARIYDKTEEIKVSQKQWFEYIWKQYGLKGQIINIEFEIKREWFLDYQVESVEDLFNSLGSIWYRLTKNYLSFRYNDNARRSRRSVCEWWEALRIETFEFDGSLLSKRKQVELNAEKSISGVLGYITSYCAAMGIKNLDNLVMKKILKEIKVMATRKDIDIGDRIKQKKQRKVSPVDLDVLLCEV